MSNFPREFPRRGELYWAPLDKVRPALVVSADQGNKFSNAVIVAALTTSIPAKQYPVNVHLPAGDPLEEPGVVLCRNLYTLLKDDLESYRADLSEEQMTDVDRALAVSLALPKPPKPSAG